jgi:hypothetical protein
VAEHALGVGEEIAWPRKLSKSNSVLNSISFTEETFGFLDFMGKAG